MRRVLATHDPLFAGHLRAVLEGHGIACLVKNEHLLGGAGEIPPLECWPELWVVVDEDEARARAIVESLTGPTDADRAWQCERCGEWMEPQFSECWQCGPIDRGTLLA